MIILFPETWVSRASPCEFWLDRSSFLFSGVMLRAAMHRRGLDAAGKEVIMRKEC